MKAAPLSVNQLFVVIVDLLKHCEFYTINVLLVARNTL